ncbi:hypothetical protein V6N13_096811 [Hibiscus sabdariffa]|uniref:Uncharacterized protein n=1 Tax=Hibiscus sabdariffa TaxID=183260 RepID=A0ABR2C8X1_9ROSI
MQGIQSQRFNNEKYIFLLNLGLLDFALILNLILKDHERKRGSGRQRRNTSICLTVSVDSGVRYVIQEGYDVSVSS